MKGRSVALLILMTLIEISLGGITIYYYSLKRWATGTIYLFIILTSIFFSIVGISEHRNKNMIYGEELRIYEADKLRGGTLGTTPKESNDDVYNQEHTGGSIIQ